MTSPDIPQPNLDRLIRIGAEDYVAMRREQEKQLGLALWKLIDLELQDVDRPQLSGDGDYYSFMQSREAQVGPHVSAWVIFRASAQLLDYNKTDWLPRVSWAALQLNIFEKELPHTDDEVARSELFISPKDRVGGSQPDTYRDVPHTISPTLSKELPVPDIETTILILGKIAGEYPNGG